MAHFAILDENNIVTEVIVIDNSDMIDENGQDSESAGIEFCKSLLGSDKNFKQTSYNNNFRKNYAGIGFTYDATRDAFIAEKPYPSWILNEDSCRWQAPVAKPNDNHIYSWNEQTVSWDLVE